MNNLSLRARALRAALAAATATVAVSAAASTGVAATTPTTEAIPTTPTIPARLASISGALSRPLLSSLHTCSGFVLNTPSRDLIATAAHCVSGSGSGYTFTPGLDAGKAPYGKWTTTRAWIDPSWKNGTSDTRDLAILQVAPRTINGKYTRIGELTGTARLAHAPSPGTAIWASGYVFGFGGSATTCLAPTFNTGPWPTFDCPDFDSGVSGGPWFAASATFPTVVGLTSGLNQGGCTPDESFSVRLGAWSDRVVTRAMMRNPADTVPGAPGDGC